MNFNPVEVTYCDDCHPSVESCDENVDWTRYFKSIRKRLEESLQFPAKSIIFPWYLKNQRKEIRRAMIKNQMTSCKLFFSEKKQTGIEWAREFGDVVIVPDGWDRTNGSFESKLITEKEYNERFCKSTCKITWDMIERFKNSK